MLINHWCLLLVFHIFCLGRIYTHVCYTTSLETNQIDLIVVCCDFIFIRPIGDGCSLRPYIDAATFRWRRYRIGSDFPWHTEKVLRQQKRQFCNCKNSMKICFPNNVCQMPILMYISCYDCILCREIKKSIYIWNNTCLNNTSMQSESTGLICKDKALFDYLRHEDKVRENKVSSHCDTLRYM